MTDTYIEQTAIDHFLNNLNVESGVPLITFDQNGKPTNVVLPNTDISMEKLGNRFFVLSWLPNDPEPAGLGTNADNRYDGIFQIDIMTPLGAGKEEAENKQLWITKLFNRGRSIDRLTVIKCYRAMHGAEEGYYRTVLRVEITATLPNLK